jgi:2-polyprenyl-3-methyl-5-hydroxy-6-metoxy-1,4-benzoquinol methylase
VREVILRNIVVMPFPSKLVNASRGCPISGSTDAVLVSSKDRHGKPLRNIMCQESGLIYVDPVPFENTEEFYQTEYRKSYKGVHCPKPKHVYRAGKIALERYSRLSVLLPPSANCLDAGSSSGEFVYLLQSRGHKANGVEANIPYAEYSQSQLEIPVSILPFSEFKTEEKFDLITMFHVLEHLEHPVRDLSHLGNFLKPNGYFAIEVPNILYPNMAFSHKWHPGHLFSFSAQTLPMLMQKAGFKTISCKPVGDGGNLWGIFQLTPHSKSELIGKSNVCQDNYEMLLKGRLSYHFRIWNYFKFLSKGFRQLVEKSSSKGKSGRDILDSIYR